MIRKRAFAIAAHLLKAAVINTYQPVWKLLQRGESACVLIISATEEIRWLLAHPDPSLPQPVLKCSPSTAEPFVVGEPSQVEKR